MPGEVDRPLDAVGIDTGSVEAAEMPDSEKLALLERERALASDVQHIVEARRAAKPIPGEAELTVVGPLIPDRRLSNDDKLIEARINRVVRALFALGTLPEAHS